MKRKIEYSRSTKVSRLLKIKRRNEDPEIKKEKLKKAAHATRARRAAETPEQREARLEKTRLSIRRKREVLKAKMKSQHRNAIMEAVKRKKDLKEINEINDAEEQLARGQRKVTELKNKLKKQSSSSHDGQENHTASGEKKELKQEKKTPDSIQDSDEITINDLCIVEITCIGEDDIN